MVTTYREKDGGGCSNGNVEDGNEWKIGILKWSGVIRKEMKYLTIIHRKRQIEYDRRTYVRLCMCTPFHTFMLLTTSLTFVVKVVSK